MTDAASISARQVFEILAREHADMLTAFLRSLLNSSDSLDDLFQETMLVAWRRLPDYDKSRPFGPWLRGIAVNLVREHRRRARRAPMVCEPEVVESLDRRFDGLSALPGDTFRERVESLSDCMRRLPEGLRHVIELAYSQGLMLRHIAESLKSTEEAVKKRIQRGREALAKCLEARGVST